jgi:hypothetical protein
MAYIVLLIFSDHSMDVFCTDNPYTASQDHGIRRILTTRSRAAEREMKPAVDLQALQVACQAAFANFRHTFLERFGEDLAFLTPNSHAVRQRCSAGV